MYGLLPELEIAKIKGRKELTKAAEVSRMIEYLLSLRGGVLLYMSYSLI